jgi:Holliday junction DNA helicase RuvA
MRTESPAPSPSTPDADALREMVWEVLTRQLGHRPSEASQLITDALRRRPAIASPEELFDEIYRGQSAAKARS